MSLVLRIQDVAKGYDGKQVLAGCSYAFDALGTYVLTGANGCGKSTFLRICALLEDPDGGTVTFADGNGALPPDLGLRRRISLVLPRVGVFNTTVDNNVAYGLRVRGVGRAERERRVERVLNYVGLADKGQQRATTLSSGETQRMGIARALVIEPEILFLDEPTASVDAKNTAIIEDILGRIRQERTTVIMTTHDRAQAERLADRILLLQDGAITGADPASR